jgi:hypothetical protein
VQEGREGWFEGEGGSADGGRSMLRPRPRVLDGFRYRMDVDLGDRTAGGGLFLLAVRQSVPSSTV